MKKLLIFIMAICLVGCSNVSVEEEAVSKMIFAMDTVMDIKIYGEQDYLIIAENRIMELENLLSVTNESSDIYMLNSKDSEFYKVSEDTLGMISDAIELCEKTEGALDISIYPILKEWGFTTSEYQIPTDYEINNLLQYVDFAQIEISDDNLIKIPDNMNIDLGSVAKGATSDILVDIFKDLGVTSGLINLGGNVHTIGTKPNGNLWNIAVKNPVNEEPLAVVSVDDKVVITSGGYERFFIGDDGNTYTHIIDPSTGKPVSNEMASVTIIGDSGFICDGYSTALFVMGMEKAIEYYKNNDEFDMVLITKDGLITISEGIEEAFSLLDSYEDREINVVRK